MWSGGDVIDFLYRLNDVEDVELLPRLFGGSWSIFLHYSVDCFVISWNIKRKIYESAINVTWGTVSSANFVWYKYLSMICFIHASITHLYGAVYWIGLRQCILLYAHNCACIINIHVVDGYYLYTYTKLWDVYIQPHETWVMLMFYSSKYVNKVPKH